MKNNLLFTVSATTLITLCSLGLALTFDKNNTKDDVTTYNSDYMISNVYQEIVRQATSNAKYQNVINAVNKKIEERELEEQRLLDEKRKQEELERKKMEESKNNLGKFNVSWYVSTCKGCSGFTAKGIDVRNTTTYQGYQIAASDWSVIPPYSIIEVEDYGKFIVVDRGGAIRGKNLDLLVATRNEAIKNGRQNLNVKVIRWGK